MSLKGFTLILTENKDRWLVGLPAGRVGWRVGG